MDTGPGAQIVRMVNMTMTWTGIVVSIQRNEGMLVSTLLQRFNTIRRANDTTTTQMLELITANNMFIPTHNILCSAVWLNTPLC